MSKQLNNTFYDDNFYRNMCIFVYFKYLSIKTISNINERTKLIYLKKNL